MPTNMADVAKRPGAARQAAADRDARPAVTLTPAEVRAVERALGAKAQVVVRILRAAGLIGAAKAAKRGADRGPRASVASWRPSDLMAEVIDFFSAWLDRRSQGCSGRKRGGDCRKFLVACRRGVDAGLAPDRVAGCVSA
jgi:hypothetical protein